MTTARIFILIICLLAGHKASCQEKERAFNHYTQAEGLSNNWVFSILKDTRGFLWVGTWNGLNKFDGKDFTAYFHEEGNPDSPPGNEFLCMDQDTPGLLWIGTDKGLFSLDPLSDRISVFPFDSALIKDSGFKRINAVLITAANEIYAGGNGLFKVNRVTKRLEPAPGDLNDKLFYGSGRMINGILQVGDILWLATSVGILAWDPGVGRWTKIAYGGEQEYLPGLEFITDLFDDGQGTVWATSWGAGLLKIDAAKLLITDYYLPQPDHKDASHNILNAVAWTGRPGEENLLWIAGISGGLYILDMKSNSFTWFGSQEPEEQGSVYREGYALLQNNETGIWIGTRLGLYHYDPRQQLILENKIRLPGTDQGKSYYLNLVKADPADPTGQTVWLGTNNQGLYSYNLASGAAHQLNSRFSRVLMPEVFVSDLHRDPSGGLWIGTLVSGLVHIDPSGKNEKQMIFINKSRESSSWITECTPDPRHDDKLWVATDGGLFLLDKTSEAYEQVMINDRGIDCSGSGISSLAWQNEGRIWFLGYDRHRKSEFVAFLDGPNLVATIACGPFSEQDPVFHHFTDLAVSDEGLLYLSSYNGLFKLEEKPEGFTLTPFQNRNKVVRSRVDDLLKDNYGRIWAQISGAIYIIDPKSDDVYELPALELKKDPRIRMNLNDITGDILAGTWDKIYIINNSNNLIDNEPLPKFITGIRIGTDYYDGRPSDFSNRSISLPFRQNNLTVEYTAISFIKGSVKNYAIRMKGYDSDWFYTGNESVSYKLPPGRYRFEMKAANASGIWDDSVVFTDIIIRPPFYRTWWFAFIILMLAATLINLIYRYRINQLIKLQKMRDRISRDLHDDIGSSLTNIAIMNEMAVMETRRGGDTENILRKSAEDIHEVISSLSDIVWNVNPVYDDLKFLFARMRWYASEVLENADILYALDIPEPGEKITMNMEQRRDFYLVFKEGLNNLVKYSKASKAEISIRVENNSVLMKISDDGKGFEPELVEFGNGLKNMRQRTEAWKGVFTVTSRPGQGTVLQFVIPVKN
jgi:signal transduction histidine kinase/ligand-binding sensor domain-containing protein